MPAMFLSHNSGDKPFVRRLADRLANSGVIVWLDEIELKIGDSIINRVSDAIEQVEYVAVVVSSNSVKSRWVKKELSLAMSKELGQSDPVVLPIRIDDCEMPSSLGDKLYADFRDANQFDAQCDRLLDAMGINVTREQFPNGISVEWTDDGPRITGNGVILSPVESSALLDRWSEWLPKFIEKERDRRGPKSNAVGEAANILAVIRACADTYNRAPDEDEMREGTSELARKFDLFYLFIEIVHFKAFESNSTKVQKKSKKRASPKKKKSAALRPPTKKAGKTSGKKRAVRKKKK